MPVLSDQSVTEIIPGREYVTELFKVNAISSEDTSNLNATLMSSQPINIHQTIDSGISAASKYSFDASKSVNSINPYTQKKPYDSLA